MLRVPLALSGSVVSILAVLSYLSLRRHLPSTRRSGLMAELR